MTIGWNRLDQSAASHVRQDRGSGAVLMEDDVRRGESG
jgi:hypothetical protein